MITSCALDAHLMRTSSPNLRTSNPRNHYFPGYYPRNAHLLTCFWFFLENFQKFTYLPCVFHEI